MIQEIKNLSDLIDFTKELISEGTNVHPDEDFTNYINIETERQAYTNQEAEHRNQLMNRCFEICELSNLDIYDLMQEIYLKETGLDKYIPIP